MLKIFVTGGSGFLGSAIVRRLVENGSEVHCLRRLRSNISRVHDIKDLIIWVNNEDVEFEEYFKTHKIDFILHCATDYGRKDIDPIATIQSNLILPLEILHAAKKNSIRAFVNTDTVLDKGINHYSLSKKQFLEWLASYSNDMACFNIALEHFYGPGDDPTKFVTYIIHSLLNTVDSIDMTEGEQKRDFIHIDDVVDAFIKIFDEIPKLENGLHKYEVGSGVPIKIKDFVTKVKYLCGNTRTVLNFGKIPYRPNEVMLSKVNTSKLKKLGWSPKVSIDSGISSTITSELGMI